MDVPSLQEKIVSSFALENDPNVETAKMKNLLEFLVKTANQNENRHKQANKFCDSIKLMSLYIFLIAGRMSYELLYKNMQNALPSITTLNRCLDRQCKIIEGYIRVNELKEFLVSRKYPLSVFISEDQTALVKAVNYNPKTNQMVGFVPIISKVTGFPTPNQFLVNNVKDIEEAFLTCHKAFNAYIYVAQPLVDGAPSFRLTIFGSDNKFSASDVFNTWLFLRDLLNKNGIQVVGFSSDGDTRCLKTMKIRSRLPNSNLENPYGPYFQVNYDLENPVFIQDPIHVSTKLKTRFLKPSIFLPMGKYSVTPQHIRELMQKFTKDKHLLCESDLKSEDKMNFQAVEKLCSEKVTALLKDMPESRATEQYLTTIRMFLNAFLDKSMKVESRIYNVWYVVFFVRIWRRWLKDSSLSLQNNFITLNAYTCLELNAHGLLLLADKCRDNQELEIFTPWCYSSQPCEKTFRQTRSMTTTFSTMVNFSLLDLLRRLDRIQALNNISTDLGDTFIFPREESKKLGFSTSIQNAIPDTAAFKNVIQNAKNVAIQDATELGIKINFDEALEHIMLSSNEINSENNKDLEESSDELQINNEEATHTKDSAAESILINSEDSEEDNPNANLFADLESLDLNQVKGSQVAKNAASCLEITLKNSKKITVRKSALCWFFSSEKGHLSADRLLRVTGECSKSERKFKKTNPNISRKISKEKGVPKIPKKKKKILDVDLDAISSEYSSEYSESDEDEILDLRESSDSEMGEMVLTEDEDPLLNDDDSKLVQLELERYYAVYYSEAWYIGRIIQVCDSYCEIKFLKSDLEYYVWPKQDDVQKVEKQYIFYGPINLMGTGPFLIKRVDKNTINKHYKSYKHNAETPS